MPAPRGLEATRNLAKSRLLAVASHELRQSLQTLVLLHEMLTKVVDGDRQQLLIARLGETLTGMTAILHAPPAVDVDVAREAPVRRPRSLADGPEGATAGLFPRSSTILVIANNKDICELLQTLLDDEGYRTAGAADGISALELVDEEAIRPDLILADLELADGLDGLQVAVRLRERFHRQIPVIALAGDLSTHAFSNAEFQDCVRFQKPVNPRALIAAVHELLPLLHAHRAPVPRSSREPGAKVFVVNNDPQVRGAMCTVLEREGFTVEAHPTGEAFLATFRLQHGACLVLDDQLPGMSAPELLERLRDAGMRLPAIVVTGHGDLQLAVRAMKAGAVDLIEKPIGRENFLDCVRRALAHSAGLDALLARQEMAAGRIAMLTHRQRQIMQLVLEGRPNKNIAAALGISQRTVENHRATIMKKTGSRSLPDLARLALAAGDVAPTVDLRVPRQAAASLIP